MQSQDRVVGAERLAAQKLDAPGGFVAGLFDEGDVGAVDDAQQQVEFGEPDGQFFAVFEHPAVDVGVGFGAEVAAGEQVLQGPAGAVRQFGDVAVEAGPALNGWPGGLVDLREGGEVDVDFCLLVGHVLAPAMVVMGSVKVKRGTAISRSRPSRERNRTVVDSVASLASGGLRAQDHSTMTWPR